MEEAEFTRRAIALICRGDAEDRPVVGAVRPPWRRLPVGVAIEGVRQWRARPAKVSH